MQGRVKKTFLEKKPVSAHEISHFVLTFLLDFFNKKF